MRKKSFVSGCMSDSKMSEEFSDVKKRTAVCYSQFDKRKTESSIMKKDLLLKTLNKAEKV